jgi:hypothetical protein
MPGRRNGLLGHLVGCRACAVEVPEADAAAITPAAVARRAPRRERLACEIMACTSALDVAMWHDTQPAQAARASQGKRSAAYARQIMSWQV